MSTANNLIWLEVPAHQARELDHIVFTSYVEGLRDAGWHGDQRLARVGYVVNAGLAIGVALQLILLEWLQTPDFVQDLEQMIGHPRDAIFEAWSTVEPFLLDLGEEAIALTRELA